MTILKNLIYLGRQTKVTSLLIIINIVWFAISRLSYPLSFVDSLNGIFFIRWGADVSQLTFSGQYWRMFTCLFMHVSITHLAMNMLALLSVGNILERQIPWFAFLGIYILSGIISSLTSDIATINNNVISCGASGAILGIISALLAYSLVNRESLKEMPVRAIIVSLILTAGLGLLPSINNMAHLGGAIAGFILGTLISLLIKWFYYSTKLTSFLISIVFIATTGCIYLVYEHFKLPEIIQQIYN